MSKPTIKFTQLFIDNEFVDATSGRTFETIDPATEEVIAKVAEGDKEDVNRSAKKGNKNMQMKAFVSRCIAGLLLRRRERSRSALSGGRWTRACGAS